MDQQNFIIYALTSQGAKLGHRLAEQISAQLWLPRQLAPEYQAQGFDALMAAVAANFSLYSAQIFICATGIVVRAIAPYLQDKTQDPAVLVLDQEGRYCVSLLSGHLGGANALTLQISRILGAEPVISTATDSAGIQAVDLLAQNKDLHIANPKALAAVNSALLQSAPLQVFDPLDRLDLAKKEQKGYYPQQVSSARDWNSQQPGIWVQEAARLSHLRQDLHLQLIPRSLVLGLGCNRGTSGQEILELILQNLIKQNLSLTSIAALASIQAKSDEPGLIQAAYSLKVPLEFVSSEEIGQVQTPNPSKAVFAHMGVYSVCEAAAMIKARSSKLLMAKTKSKNATLAIARREP
ncbi:MAG: cobalt-precorrin 5A hydrolase [Desulfohalobiaceae bacterium]